MDFFSILILLVTAYFVFKKYGGSGSGDNGSAGDAGKVQWLRNETIRWLEKNIISIDQQKQILFLYGEENKESGKFVPYEAGKTGGKLSAIKILYIMSAILLGLGAFLFVASNWEKIPDIVRTLMVLSVTFGTFYLGYVFSYEKTGYSWLGKALLLLASIFWGASIALIGQIYHIPTSDNWLIFILWGVPILPVAYYLESRPVFLLSSAIFFAWNFFFSQSKDAANYYYPLIVFALLLPLSKEDKLSVHANVAALLIAAFYAMFGRHQDYLILLIAAGLLAYCFIKRLPIYFISSSAAFLVWLIAFSSAHPDSPNYYFIVPLALLFYSAYETNLKEALAINLLSFVVWFNLLLLAVSKTVFFDKSFEIAKILVLLLVGIIYYLIGIGYCKEEFMKEFSKVYKIFGFVLVVLFVYAFSFKAIYPKSAVLSYELYFFTALILGLISLVLLAINSLKNAFVEKSSKYELIALVTVLVTVFIVLFAPMLSALNSILMNGVLLLISVLTILSGFEHQNKSEFDAGIAIFVVLVVTRYFDTLWQFLPRSVSFIISGLLLLAFTVLLDRQRRKFIGMMKNG